jgi:hypothetical protein
MTNQIISVEGSNIPSIKNISKIQIENPYIEYDLLNDLEKKPIIKISEDIKILKDIDFILYAKELDPDQTWAKRQKYKIYLLPEDYPIEKDFKKLNRLPANHLFEIDMANFKIRIIGPFVNQEGVGRWRYF